MEMIRAFFRAIAKLFRRKADKPNVVAQVAPRAEPPPLGRMTEAQIARMKTLDGTPTEELVIKLARLRRLSIDEALTMIEGSQRDDYKRIVM